MTYAFIIVVSVAVTLKLLFLSFSLYVTLNDPELKMEVSISCSHLSILLFLRINIITNNSSHLTLGVSYYLFIVMS